MLAEYIKEHLAQLSEDELKEIGLCINMQLRQIAKHGDQIQIAEVKLNAEKSMDETLNVKDMSTEEIATLRSNIKLIAAGNHGALDFLIKLATMPGGYYAVEKIKRAGIRGTNAYILYNVIAKRNLKKVIEVLELCPEEILVEACRHNDAMAYQIVISHMAVPIPQKQTV